MRIVAINPGATTTKVGVFDDEREVFSHEITYASDAFDGEQSVFDSLDLRHRDVEELLSQPREGYDPSLPFDAAVGRGGLIGPVGPGAYLVDDEFEDRVRNHPVLDHASNLGGPLARRIAASRGVRDCPAFIYDAVTVDEMDEVFRITGVPQIRRTTVGHHLNMRAVAIDVADQIGLGYAKANIIVVHLGGGTSASAHREGRVVDWLSDDEAQFSAERSGGIPVRGIIALDRMYSPDEVRDLLRRKAGLQGHLGTKDLREVERRIDDGDEHAALVFDALALQVAKAFGTLAVSLEGRVDALVLTGGMARSQRLCDRVAQRTGFIAPLHPFPGEAELQALASGARRVLTGQEQARTLAQDEAEHPIWARRYPG